MKFYCEPPTGSFRLLSLQASKKKLSYPTQLSAPKTVEWLGRYAQFRGIGPICPGWGGGVHGADLHPILGKWPVVKSSLFCVCIL
jgi:hypothetical protein